jgi:hypothetical protein
VTELVLGCGERPAFLSLDLSVSRRSCPARPNGAGCAVLASGCGGPAARRRRDGAEERPARPRAAGITSSPTPQPLHPLTVESMRSPPARTARAARLLEVFPARSGGAGAVLSG